MKRIFSFFVKILFLTAFVLFKQGEFDDLHIPKIFNSPIARIILHFIIFWLTVNIVIRFVQFIYRKRKKYGDKFSDNVIVGLQNIYYMISVIALIVSILAFFGVEPKELVTGLSILAASIAIITKDIALDIICGIQISFSKVLAIGDYVKIAELKGTVVDINIYKIILLNENDDIIYIPNSKAYFSELINYTQKEIRKYNIDFSINNQIDLSIDELNVLFLKELENYTGFLDSTEQNLRIIGIAKDETRYKIQFKLNQVNPKMAEAIKSRIMDSIVKKIHNH